MTLVDCCCGRWRRGDGQTTCTSKATREDLLCDVCREGCAAICTDDWTAHVGDVRIK